MKKLSVIIINYIIQKAKRNKFIQSLFESPFNIESYTKFGDFQDKHGKHFILFKELRNKIRPGWESIYQRPSQFSTDKNIIEENIKNGKVAVDKLLPLINTFLNGINNKSVLEIGCHSGANSFRIAELGAKNVMGTEFSGYKIDSIGEKLLLEEVNDELKVYRNKISKFFSKTDKVTFVDDDICNSNLVENTYDLVCSWDVFEHLSDPAKALMNIAKVLKPEGISIHEYNPFHCLNGGHSLCTLDFLWGHAQLDQDDFLRYLKKIRPLELKKAGAFYNKGLNRMTLNELVQHSKSAGLEIVALFKFTKEQHVRMLNMDILDRCRKNYSSIVAEDLVTPRIIVVHKKTI